MSGRSRRGWVNDAVSLDAIADELQRRQGVKYPWGEYKREPAGYACQCDDCQRERNTLQGQARKRADDLGCPQRACKGSKPSERECSLNDYIRQHMVYGSIFHNPAGSHDTDVWNEVTKLADARPINVPSAKAEKAKQQKADSVPVMKTKRIGNMLFHFDKHGKFITSEPAKPSTEVES